MKIAIFTDTFAPDVNGVAVTLKHYTQYLDSKGIEYIVFAPDNKKENNFDSQIRRFASLPFYLYPECRLALPNMFKVKAELQRFKPDIIHIVTPFNIGYCGLRYAKKHNIPLVGSYHTNFDKYLEYYNLQFLKPFVWKYMKWFHKSFRKIFVPSNDTIAQLKKKGFMNLQIWPGGVDCELFHPNYDPEQLRKKYSIKEKFILSFVGRLAPEKDIDTLMKISSQLPDKIKSQVHWLIVGDGPSKEEMMKNAPANMTFTGFLNGAELAQVYSGSDIFVFPSPTETFGNVVIESLASGTPVIGANSGGVKNLIKQSITGTLCEPKAVQQFIDAIILLIENHSLRNQWSLNAREFALSQSWDAIFDQLLLDYQEALDQIEQLKNWAS
ncbi:glycosyltransferase family 1 protein [Caldibacillus lycopersici]|uniref:Glycosyltransferase family 1 protein n=1 Tax=Perspicuibacillus lycopersici TaxID=1325689 RepID=A0AAE3LN12_9BACI|nr:glycosyltransferase family 1 protein [Perspicuibacillus lycopersici]MCU9614155.1 glycosyltransferase family 1 protein [Perspicuibacillus lycopersici]